MKVKDVHLKRSAVSVLGGVQIGDELNLILIKEHIPVLFTATCPEA